MAAPTLTLAASGTNGTATTSHVVSLPSGTADKVIWIVSFSEVATAAVASATDWTLAKTYSITQNDNLYVLTRAQTSETSVTVTTSESAHTAWVGGSTDGDIANAVFSDGVTGNGSTNDPDAVTVDLGDYRVGAMVTYENGSRAINSYPTDYTDNQVNPRISGSGRPALGLATRGLTGITSEDPGSFGMHGGSGDNIASTMAIPEASGGTQGLTGALFQSTPTFPQGEVGGGAVTLTGTLFTSTPTFPTGVVDTGYPGGLPEAAVIGIWDARSLEGSDTDPVASWPDIGPKSQNALAQATEAEKPIISDVSGRRWVLFDGSDDWLQTALDQTYSGDFAIVLVLEPLTYPTGTAHVPYSTGHIGSLEKNILGVDDVESGWPDGAWVVMSGPEGTQAEHHHGTALTLDEDLTSTRFIMTQLVRDAGEHKLWENSTLVIDESDSAQGDSLNNLAGLDLGCREDESRHMHMRVGYVLLVDMASATEAELLDSRDALATQFEIDAHALGGQLFVSTPSFFSGTVAAGTVDLAGQLFTSTATFQTGTVDAVYDLTGSLFQLTSTFFTGAVAPGAVDLDGNLFTSTPSFPTGTIQSEGGPQTLTGDLFTSAPTFHLGAVEPGAVDLAGQLFTSTPTFQQGAVAASYGLDGTLFTSTPSFFTGAVDAESGAQALTGTLFVSAPTFHAGAVDGGTVTLQGELFQSAPAFPQGTLSGLYQLDGSLFVSSATFNAGAVTTESALVGTLFVSSATFHQGTVELLDQFLTGTLFTSTPTFLQGTVTVAGQVRPTEASSASGSNQEASVGSSGIEPRLLNST